MVMVMMVVMAVVILAALHIAEVTFLCKMAELLCWLPGMQRKAKLGVALWAGLVPDNAHDPALLQSLLDHGFAGFKSFMSPAG